jgi:hypothetical protein
VTVVLAASWRKSTLSDKNGCVEVKLIRGGSVALRASKNHGGPVLRFASTEWQAFLAGVRNGEFDLPSADH